MELLTVNNTKTIRGMGAGYMTFILHLAPYNLSGYQVCPRATPGCIAACLNLAGHGGMIPLGATTNRVQEARKRRTRWFFEDRDGFMLALAQDVQRGINKARRLGLTPVFRLNGTSDLSWEKYMVPGPDCNIFELFSDVQFYDYTAVLGRKVGHIPNYHLTFSRKENNDHDVQKALAAGMNVAAVYDEIPQGMYSADETDLRFLDGQQGMMGLKVKGWRAKKDYSGFVIRLKSVV
jgi:hypothetical protein